MSHHPHRPIPELLERVRARWRRVMLFQAVVRGALAATGIFGIALFIGYWTGRAPFAIALVGVIADRPCCALVCGLWPVRDVPSDARVARFIEEAEPSLDDRLVTAVDVMTAPRAEGAGLSGPMLADAARAASEIDPERVVPAAQVRRSGFQAIAAALLLVVVGYTGRDLARQSFDALSLALFPSRITLEVTPGNARLEAGAPLTIEARLVGNRAPVVAHLLQTDPSQPENADQRSRATEMAPDASGKFRLVIGSVGAPFRYRVRIGAVTSPSYDVSVARAPRVTRIDVEYSFPAALGLPPRTEEDSGDIYAPAGTDVRLRVHTDRDAATGQLTLGDGKTIPLAPGGTALLAGGLKVLEDNSYRIALTDADGLRNPGDTEYFIRTLEDRPPEVHLVKPARDRDVTPLEEVDIEARADDDFGVQTLDLVYAVNGGAEKVVPLEIPQRATSVDGKHMLPLEDLDVAPGDFVSYYARARDLARGKRSSEARSDIFFLEVKPFDQEFALAKNQEPQGGSGNPQLDDLVTVQKEIIVATWKLDRRSQAAGAKSDDDIRSVARAESDSRRVEETASSFRESAMRDPGRRAPQAGRGAPAPGGLRAGQTLPEEDDMTAAATLMEKAITVLNELHTKPALPSEMAALNHLLKAQSDVKKREIGSQQAGAGNQNRSNVDVSSLFDKELQRQQKTNYETRASTEPTSAAGPLDKIKDLARRQDELNQRQQDLHPVRDQTTPEEVEELEKLTREQSDLRQKAEDLARQMSQQGKPDGKNAQQNQQNQPDAAGQPPQSAQSSQSGQQPSGQHNRPGSSRPANSRQGSRASPASNLVSRRKGASRAPRRSAPRRTVSRCARSLKRCGVRPTICGSRIQTRRASGGRRPPKSFAISSASCRPRVRTIAAVRWVTCSSKRASSQMPSARWQRS